MRPVSPVSPLGAQRHRGSPYSQPDRHFPTGAGRANAERSTKFFSTWILDLAFSSFVGQDPMTFLSSFISLGQACFALSQAIKHGCGLRV